MGKSAHTQSDDLVAALRRGPLTALEILDQCGIARAAARVHDLRKAGYVIDTDTIEVFNRQGNTCRVARYILRSEPRALPLFKVAA